jgi:hypothetical protein
MASVTLWKDSIVWHLCSLAWSPIELSTTDLLSPNMKFFSLTGTPRYLRVLRRSIICSMHIHAATNSELYVAVYTVACFLEYQSSGVLLMRWSIPVTDFPVVTSCTKSDSITCLPSGSGASLVAFLLYCPILYTSNHTDGLVCRNSWVLQF